MPALGLVANGRLDGVTACLLSDKDGGLLRDAFPIACLGDKLSNLVSSVAAVDVDVETGIQVGVVLVSEMLRAVGANAAAGLQLGCGLSTASSSSSARSLSELRCR